MFGHLIPDHWNAQIAVNFAHRLGAVVVAAAVLSTAIYIWRRYTDRSELAQPGLVIVLLTIVQITLGALTIITGRDPLINSVHVVCGALVLTMSLVITLRAWRARFPAAVVRLKPDTTATVRRVRLQADEARS
jgi:heme A synthase